MPVSGLKEAKRKTAEIVGRITGDLSVATVEAILIIGSGNASVSTPVATSLLFNSQYRHISSDGSGVHGRVGYTAAYAAAVENAKGTLLGTNTPRSPATLGNVWDPGAKPHFLRDGFESSEARSDIAAAVKRGMAL